MPVTVKIGLEAFDLTDAEVKALRWDIVDLKEWGKNALKNKARQCIDRIVEDVTDKRAVQIGTVEKEQIVLDANIKTAAERQAEFEASLK
jgi:hypothetical protein